MKQLSIVIPAYNEERRLRSSLESVVAFCRRELDEWEVIVIDDGSRDRTGAIASEFPEVRCLRSATNRGKGQSVRRGMLEARLDPVLFSDVDLSTPIEEALDLLRAVGDGADVAIGSRRRSAAKTVRRSRFRKLQAAVFRWLVKAIVLRGVHDTQCGFKAFRREAALAVFPVQRLEGWAFDVEVLFLARRLGYRVVEVPVRWEAAGESRLTRLSAFQMLRDLFRIRWYALTGRYGAASRAREGAPARTGVD